MQGRAGQGRAGQGRAQGARQGTLARPVERCFPSLLLNSKSRAVAREGSAGSPSCVSGKVFVFSSKARRKAFTIEMVWME